MDHVSKEVRSKIMASVHSKGNQTTEIVFGRLLWGQQGESTFRYVFGQPADQNREI